MRGLELRIWGWGARLGAALAVLIAAAPASAQNVVDLLREQRRDARVAEVMAEIGDRVAPRGLRLGESDDFVLRSFYAVAARRQAARDSLVRANEAAADSAIEAARLAVARWRKVESGAQGDFLDRYRETYWQAARTGRTLLDTTATPLLRGRLQAAFGRPTRNADAQRRYGYGGSEFVQFEYWFVVNDTIPILALDLDGPFGHGLLIAGAEEQAALLPRLKDDLAARLGADARLDPYVDYYRSFEREQWYRTGFNGAEFFTQTVRRPPRWSGQTAGDRWIIHR